MQPIARPPIGNSAINHSCCQARLRDPVEPFEEHPGRDACEDAGQHSEHDPAQEMQREPCLICDLVTPAREDRRPAVRFRHECRLPAGELTAMLPTGEASPRLARPDASACCPEIWALCAPYAALARRYLLL